MHNVKCSVCGVTFDRDRIQAVKTSPKRYAHLSCCPDGELVPLPNGVNPELVELEDYIKKLFGIKRITKKIKEQIKSYIEEYDYSYSGILKSLIYWFEIKGNSIEKANGGIGIVPYVYKDAYEYWYAVFLANEKNQAKAASDFNIRERVIEIDTPTVYTQPIKLFKFEEDEE